MQHNQDVEWWLRDKLQALNYTTWFAPSVSVIADEDIFGSGSSPTAAAAVVIGHGDLVHVDFGVTALGLNTDTQHLAYVLRPGETAAPAGLVEGLNKARRMQDIVRANMAAELAGAAAKTGNDILRACLAQMATAGIAGQV